MKMVLVPSGHLSAVFSDDTCMYERKRERKKGGRKQRKREREQARKLESRFIGTADVLELVLR